MNYMNGVLIDSNVIVEGLKGNKEVEELFFLISENCENFNYLITTNTFEEIHYILLREFSGKPYWKLKKDKKLVKKVFSEDVENFWDYFLLNFTIIPVTEKILKIAKMVIKEYGLLPNDAIILATCKHYGIKYLVSMDREDFTIPCEKEGIVLIDSVEKLIEVLNK